MKTIINVAQQESELGGSKVNLGFLVDANDLVAQNINNNNLNSRHVTQEANNGFEVTWNNLNYSVKQAQTDGPGLIGNVVKLAGTVLSSIESGSSILWPTNNKGSYDLRQTAAATNIEEANNYSKNNDRIHILKQLNGSFKSGELTAIMGPSGAGKTSLLNLLSRRQNANFTGSLGVRMERSQRLKVVAIPQHDRLPEYLTVRENLMYASKLKNPANGTSHHEAVLKVCRLLGLDECLDTRTRNISGGQEKRLAIAQELLSRPDILILDEPTSGLDSSSCIKTLALLKNLVKASAERIINPMAIVVTIHQPQEEAFHMFDKVYVMAPGGLAIYDGPPSECTEFVKKHTGISMPSEDYNPATFIIDIASGINGDEPIRKLEHRVRSLANKHNELGQLMTNKQLQIDKHQQSLVVDPRLKQNLATNSDWLMYRTGILIKRNFVAMTRDPLLLGFRLIATIGLAFGMSFVYGTQPGHANACPRYYSNFSLKELASSDNDIISEKIVNEFMDALENTSILFLMINTQMMVTVGMVTLCFALDLRTSLKEYYNAWYPLNSHLIARVVANLPMDVFLPLSQVIVIYYATEQTTTNSELESYMRVAIIAAGAILSVIISGILGMIIGTFYKDHITTAVFMSQSTCVPFALLSGFTTRTKSMSRIMQLLSYYVSVLKHPLDICMISRYGFNVCACDSKTFKPVEQTVTGVPERLNDMIRFYARSQIDPTEGGNNTLEDIDLFKLLAKQVSLFNTYGNEIKSCTDYKPFILHDFGLSEADLRISFISLSLMLIFYTVVMMISIKYLLTRRSAL